MQTHRPQSTKAERQAHMDAWHQSQLSQQRYCNQAGINYFTFNSWVTKQKLKPTEQQKFLAVEVTGDSSCALRQTFATLTFSNRLTLELHKEVTIEFLKQLITCK